MAAQQRPGFGGRRGASGAWSRLKTPPVDALEVYGLPSKGETRKQWIFVADALLAVLPCGLAIRLNDFKVQETYYNKIVERYMKFCAASGGGDELDRQFAAMSLQSSSKSNNKSNNATNRSNQATQPPTTASMTSTTSSMLPAPPRTSSTANADATTVHTELQTIHSAMRKLRESITATSRTDTFAQRAYTFIIRAAILTNTPSTYHPALLYLLYHIHPLTPLPPPELAEFSRYRVLDLACRIGELRAARETQVRGFDCCLKGDARTRGLLSALVRGDWVGFWRLRRCVDGYQLRILSWAEEGVRWHALKCIGRTYFGAERKFVERAAGKEWAKLVEEGVGWELRDDGDWVVIRKPKPRKP